MDFRERAGIIFQCERSARIRAAYSQYGDEKKTGNTDTSEAKYGAHSVRLPRPLPTCNGFVGSLNHRLIVALHWRQTYFGIPHRYRLSFATSRR